MTDVVDAATRSRMMASIKNKDTNSELFVRKALHGVGFRYRLGGYKLPGKPDIVFSSKKIAIFVHGCFWHRHTCKYFKWPATNQDFWQKKLNQNASRDEKVQAELKELGWRVLIIWECELRQTFYKQPNPTINRIINELNFSLTKNTESL